MARGACSAPSPLAARNVLTSRRVSGVGFWPWRLWPTKPVTPGRVADAVPGLVVHAAANEQVAREDLALHGHLATVLELDDVLHRDDDLEDLVLHVHALDASMEVGRDLLLVAGLRVHDEPLAGPGPRVVDRLGSTSSTVTSVTSSTATSAARPPDRRSSRRRRRCRVRGLQPRRSPRRSRGTRRGRPRSRRPRAHRRRRPRPPARRAAASSAIGSSASSVDRRRVVGSTDFRLELVDRLVGVVGRLLDVPPTVLSRSSFSAPSVTSSASTVLSSSTTLSSVPATSGVSASIRAARSAKSVKVRFSSLIRTTIRTGSRSRSRARRRGPCRRSPWRSRRSSSA